MRVEDAPASQLPLHSLCIISSYWFMGRMLSMSLRQVHSATLCHQLVAYVLLVGRVETLLLCVDKMAMQLLRQLPHFKTPWYSLCSGLCFHLALCTCGHTCPLHQLGMFYGRNECAILWSQPAFPFTPWLTPTLIETAISSASSFSPHMMVNYVSRWPHSSLFIPLFSFPSMSFLSSFPSP